VATATWELVYLLRDMEVHRLFVQQIPERLTELKAQFTEMRLDWMHDGPAGEGDGFRVMVGDVEALKAVILKLKGWGPQKIQVTLTDDRLSGEVWLGEEEDGCSISVLTDPA
jgi:hypothetical protein